MTMMRTTTTRTDPPSPTVEKTPNSAFSQSHLPSLCS